MNFLYLSKRKTIAKIEHGLLCKPDVQHCFFLLFSFYILSNGCDDEYKPSAIKENKGKFKGKEMKNNLQVNYVFLGLLIRSS